MKRTVGLPYGTGGFRAFECLTKESNSRSYFFDNVDKVNKMFFGISVSE